MYTPISNYKILLISITFTTTALVNKHMLLEEQVIAVKLKKTEMFDRQKNLFLFCRGRVGLSYSYVSLYIYFGLSIRLNKIHSSYRASKIRDSTVYTCCCKIWLVQTETII